MILNSLGNFERYLSVHPLFEKVVEFINGNDLSMLLPGSIEIDGKNLYVNIFNGPGVDKSESNVEVHRRYIDIQFVISGVENMGWIPIEQCSEPVDEYDQKNDYQFFRDNPVSWITVHPGQFVVFFPEDGHQPLISDGNIHKLIFKLLVE